MTEEKIAVIGVVLLVMLCVAALLAIGHGVMQVLFRTIRPLEAWADREIDKLEARQGDTDYGDGYDIWGNCLEYADMPVDEYDNDVEDEAV